MVSASVSATAPSIPLFGDAYLADTRHLSLEEHGAYLQLMMIAWRTEGCCLPDDDSRLARMLGVTVAKWRKIKPTVMAFWKLEDGAWKQSRLSKERKFVEEKRAKNKASADARWNNQPLENKADDECERISERNAPPPPPTKGKKEGETNVSPIGRAQGQRLPDDWEPRAFAPDTVSGQIAAARGHDWAARALESFRNHWRSANGPNARKRDWQAAWANWIIEQDNRDGRRPHSLGRNQPDDGLSSTARAAIAVFGPPSAGHQR
jgi:uncharacterized protein YdaU (DUF1376 family)